MAMLLELTPSKADEILTDPDVQSLFITDFVFRVSDFSDAVIQPGVQVLPPSSSASRMLLERIAHTSRLPQQRDMALTALAQRSAAGAGAGAAVAGKHSAVAGTGAQQRLHPRRLLQDPASPTPLGDATGVPNLLVYYTLLFEEDYPESGVYATMTDIANAGPTTLFGLEFVAKWTVLSQVTPLPPAPPPSPPLPPPPPEQLESSTPVGLIAGVVGATVGALLVGACVFAWYKWRQRRRSDAYTPDAKDGDGKDGTATAKPGKVDDAGANGGACDDSDDKGGTGGGGAAGGTAAVVTGAAAVPSKGSGDEDADTHSGGSGTGTGTHTNAALSVGTGGGSLPLDAANSLGAVSATTHLHTATAVRAAPAPAAAAAAYVVGTPPPQPPHPPPTTDMVSPWGAGFAAAALGLGLSEEEGFGTLSPLPSAGASGAAASSAAHGRLNAASGSMLPLPPLAGSAGSVASSSTAAAAHATVPVRAGTAPVPAMPLASVSPRGGGVPPGASRDPSTASAPDSVALVSELLLPALPGGQTGGSRRERGTSAGASGYPSHGGISSTAAAVHSSAAARPRSPPAGYAAAAAAVVASAGGVPTVGPASQPRGSPTGRDAGATPGSAGPSPFAMYPGLVPAGELASITSPAGLGSNRPSEQRSDGGRGVVVGAAGNTASASDAAARTGRVDGVGAHGARSSAGFNHSHGSSLLASLTTPQPPASAYALPAGSAPPGPSSTPSGTYSAATSQQRTGLGHTSSSGSELPVVLTPAPTPAPSETKKILEAYRKLALSGHLLGTTNSVPLDSVGSPGSTAPDARDPGPTSMVLQGSSSMTSAADLSTAAWTSPERRRLAATAAAAAAAAAGTAATVGSGSSAHANGDASAHASSSAMSRATFAPWADSFGRASLGASLGASGAGTARGGLGTTAEQRMGGKVAELAPHPDVQFELDWARDITVYRDIFLGAGATGLVYKGEYNGEVVAIKVIIPSSGHNGPGAMDAEDIASMQQELQIMARLCHQNVVRIYGGCMSPPNLFVVSELMVGDLCTHIHRRGSGSNKQVAMGLPTVLALALDIIRGLVYLHSLDIIHRDLKPGNILMTSDGVAKIADFGLARCKYKTYLSTKKLDAGTVAYMAPECFNDKLGGVSTKCDIFSLGVILWELVTQSRPWNGLNEFQMIYQVTVEGARLQIPTSPEKCPPELHDLIASCWASEPRLRPSAEEVEARLVHIQSSVL